MFYTYILRSIPHPTQRYIGHTTDLRSRLDEHNSGKSPHTAKFRPWKVETYIAFESIDKAQAFERYLKTGSGHEFARRHFYESFCAMPNSLMATKPSLPYTTIAQNF